MLTTGESVVSEGRRVYDKRGEFPVARKLAATFSTRHVQMHFFYFHAVRHFLFFSCLFVYSLRSPVLALYDAFLWYNSLKERLSVRS